MSSVFIICYAHPSRQTHRTSLDTHSLATTKHIPSITCTVILSLSHPSPVCEIIMHNVLRVYENTDSESAVNKLLPWGNICIMFTSLRYMFFCVTYQNHSLPLHTPHSALYSCLCASVSVCVCQTALLHPLLHLFSQLRARRERGVSTRVRTTPTSSPVTLHLLFSVSWNNLIDGNKAIKIEMLCFSA